MRPRALAPVLAAAAGLVGLPAVAQAAGPSCGDTVTHDVKLHANLDCSGGGTAGLIVGKNGVTIDLGGHSITGAGGVDGYYGIDDESHDKVTVENGTIKNFYDDLYVYYGSQSRFSKLKLVSDDPGSYTGAYVSGTGNDTLDHITSTDAYDSFYLEDNGSLHVSASKAMGYFDDGFYVSNDAGDRIANSYAKGDPSVSTTSLGFYDYEGSGNSYAHDTGLHGYDGFQLERPTRIHLSHVVGKHNSDSGVWFRDDAPSSGYVGNSIKNSLATDNNYGLYSDSPGVASARNKAFDNVYGCYYVACN